MWQTISTLTIPIPALSPSQLPHLESWLRSLLWDRVLPTSPTNQPQPQTEAATANTALDIHRLKGRVLTTEGKQIMIQGVREVFEMVELDGRAKGLGKLVLIGRLGRLDLEILEGSLKRFLEG